MKLNAVIRCPHDWLTQLSNVYLAPDLLPQGRIGSRYSLDTQVVRVGYNWKVQLVWRR